MKRPNRSWGAVHWLDSRGGVYNRRITRGFPTAQGYNLPRLCQWIRRSGLAPTHSGADSVGHVLYIRHARPDIYERTCKFLEPMDYLTARLTGRITATQKTMAPFMVCDNRRWDCRTYDDTLLRLAGLDGDKFPDLLPNDGVVGSLLPSVASRLRLDPTTRVVSGVADSFASLIGSGAIENADPIVYIGTSFYLTCHMARKKTDLLHMLTALPSYFADRYYLFGEQGAGGRCVDHFLDNIVYDRDDFASCRRPADAYDRFDRMAATVPPGSGGLVFMPWLNGAMVPCEAPHTRGGFVNLTLDTRRRHMARAIMEGLAYNSRWTMGPAAKLAGMRFTRLLFSGGGARSELWAQIHADILGLPVHQVADPVMATVRGTALLALVSLKQLAPADLPERVPARRICEPDPGAAKRYDDIYPAYLALFNRTRKVFERLNTLEYDRKEESHDRQQ
jgi:xylulokinase